MCAVSCTVQIVTDVNPRFLKYPRKALGNDLTKLWGAGSSTIEINAVNDFSHLHGLRIGLHFAFHEVGIVEIRIESDRMELTKLLSLFCDDKPVALG